jgi:hypothetical protein
VDWTDLAQNMFCEHGDEASGSVKVANILTS